MTQAVAAVLMPHARIAWQLRLESDCWLHFSRFLECLCLNDGAFLFADDVADAAHWHQTMLTGQYR